MEILTTSPIIIISNKEVLSRVPYSSVQIWRKENAGEFPRRVKLGANRVGWVESEIESWISSKIAERDQ
jgi:prophage regulatory protein|tara:strand:- start:177 stop:383 length:207 start_codon:yes stop_codon:yes gene_type:complete